MSSVYTGVPANVTASASPTETIPSDGDLRNVASITTALQKLLDYIANIFNTLINGTLTVVAATVNSIAIVGTGNGTGAGLSGTGGATGPGVAATAGGGGTPARGALALGGQATPSAPTNGDVWVDTTVTLPRVVARLNGVTAGPTTAITPGGGWGAAGNGLAYWKDATGVVHMKGSAVWLTGATTMFTFPAGFKPAAALTNGRQFACVNLGGSNLIGVAVDSSGNVILNGIGAVANGNTIMFDGVSFLAEA